MRMYVLATQLHLSSTIHAICLIIFVEGRIIFPINSYTAKRLFLRLFVKYTCFLRVVGNGYVTLQV